MAISRPFLPAESSRCLQFTIAPFVIELQAKRLRTPLAKLRNFRPVMGSSGSCRVWGYDPTRSWLRCRALRATRSDVERVWSIGPARPDLLKLEIDPLDHISGISKLWADPLDDSAGSGVGSRVSLHCNVTMIYEPVLALDFVTIRIFPVLQQTKNILTNSYPSHSREVNVVLSQGWNRVVLNMVVFCVRGENPVLVSCRVSECETRNTGVRVLCS